MKVLAKAISKSVILGDFNMFGYAFLLFFHKSKKIYVNNIDLVRILGYNEKCTIFGTFRRERTVLDIRPGDILTMKKNHPCGANEMLVIRAGMDFRLKCVKCSHEFMVPRNKIEKSIRSVKRPEEG